MNTNQKSCLALLLALSATAHAGLGWGDREQRLYDGIVKMAARMPATRASKALMEIQQELAVSTLNNCILMEKAKRSMSANDFCAKELERAIQKARAESGADKESLEAAIQNFQDAQIAAAISADMDS